MGWRAIRLGLDRPALLRIQMRSLLLAASGRTLKMMLPMVTDVSEVKAARAMLEREKAHLCRHGHKLPEEVALGAMIEVPALLYQLDELMAATDFVSIGSNDLLQFVMASDRGNTRVADRFDPLSRPFLRALRSVVRSAERAGVALSLCGEMAGRPLAAITLVGLGLRTLSMSAASIGPVKAGVLALDAGRLGSELDSLLDQPDNEVLLRDSIKAFADDMRVPV
jgi:phosphotransferase system enzyme I (PtsP)